MQLVLALLMAGSGNLETNPRQVGDTSNIKLKQLPMEVLCQLCLVNKTAQELLGETNELLIFSFHHLNHPTLYEKCCLMIEHI